MSQPHRRLTPQGLSYNQNKIDTPSVMMTFTAARAERGLASLLAGSVIRGHDVRQFMQARLLAFTGAIPAVRADLDPALNSISVADPLPARHGHRNGMCRERGHEPGHLLDGMDVTCAMLIGYYSVTFD